MNPIPTPTAYAYEITEYITALNPSDYSIWNFTDEAIQIWNYDPNLGLVVQVGIIVVIVVIFVALMIRLVGDTSEQ